MTMIMSPLSGRNCFIADVPAPKLAQVVLHARGMTAYTMYNCMVAKKAADLGVLTICVPSLKVDEWDYQPGSPDVLWVDALPVAIRAMYPTLGPIHLVGFSNGAETAASVALYGTAQYASQQLVCGTMRTDVVEPQPPRVYCPPTTLYLGTQDDLVPITGNSQSISAAQMQARFAAVGGSCALNTFVGGHSWPGGKAPCGVVQVFTGKWPPSPDMTTNVANALLAMLPPVDVS